MFLDPRPCFDSAALYWLSISSGVKITQQGFYFYDEPIIHDSVTYDCPRALDALCNHTAAAAAGGAPMTTLFLPCTAAPLVPVSDVPPPFDRFWRWEVRCGKAPTPSREFHVTPCDLQRGTALVWSEGRLSVQYELELPYWPNMIMLLIVIWLVVNLGESISLILEVDGAQAQNHSTAALCVTLVALVIAHTPNGTWCTQGEVVLYWFVMVYILLYSLYHIRNPNTVSVIVGCLILVSSRMYETHETPYAGSMLFLIAARLVQKVALTGWAPMWSAPAKQEWFSWVRMGFMALDVALFALFYLYAFQPSVRHGPQQAQLYVTALLFAAACLGLTVVRYAKGRAAMHSKRNATTVGGSSGGDAAVKEEYECTQKSTSNPKK